MGKITGGEIKYGRTVKTGDFENKRVDVALTFTVEDGEDHADIVQAAAKEAHDKAHAMLGIKVTADKPVSATEPKPEPKADKAPAGRTKADIEAETTAALKTKAVKAPKAPKPAATTVAPPTAPAADDFSEFNEDAVESQPEITDAAMSTAMNKKVGELKVVHAGAAPKLVKELINKFVEPPKKSHDIPQNLRAEFLKKLEALV